MGWVMPTEGRAPTVKPGSRLYLGHRCRYALGVEAMSFQGIAYECEEQRLVMSQVAGKDLQNLAGNAFNAWCATAVRVVGRTILVRAKAAAKGQVPHPTASSVGQPDAHCDLDEFWT